MPDLLIADARAFSLGAAGFESPNGFPVRDIALSRVVQQSESDPNMATDAYYALYLHFPNAVRVMPTNIVETYTWNLSGSEGGEPLAERRVRFDGAIAAGYVYTRLQSFQNAILYALQTPDDATVYRSRINGVRVARPVGAQSWNADIRYDFVAERGYQAQGYFYMGSIHLDYAKPRPISDWAYINLYHERG